MARHVWKEWNDIVESTPDLEDGDVIKLISQGWEFTLVVNQDADEDEDGFGGA